MERKRYLIFGASVLIWLCYLLFITRTAMLDDALIHLRYADFLRKLHYITYDGIHQSFGTSSLLYVTILALASGAVTTALLPKIVSCIAYLSLVGILLSSVYRFRKSKLGHAIWLGLLLTTLSPMGVRWLTDGMETSVVTLAVVVLAFIIDSLLERRSITSAWSVGLAMFGFVLVLLRVELACLIVLAPLSLLTGKKSFEGQDSRRYASDLIAGASLVFGAGVALSLIRVAFGSLLPDTALAKSGFPSLEIAGAAIHVIASSMVLGISSVLLYAISAGLVLRGDLLYRKSWLGRLSWAFANGALPLVVILACLRGQAIQGIRYLLWPIFYSIAWNALQLERDASDLSRQPLLNLATCNRLFVGYAIFLGCLLPIDWHYAMRAMLGRAATFIAMRSAGLEAFRDENIIAADVGFIGYFTAGNVCDIDGLVNGREAAMESQPERIDQCVEQHPRLAFLTNAQAIQIDKRMSLNNWTVCQAFDFENVRGNDRHYLMVSNADGDRYCAKLGRPLGAVYRVVPGLK